MRNLPLGIPQVAPEPAGIHRPGSTLIQVGDQYFAVVASDQVFPRLAVMLVNGFLFIAHVEKVNSHL